MDGGMPVVSRPWLHNGSRYQSNTIIDEHAPTGILVEIFARLEVRHLGQEGSMLKERGMPSSFFLVKRTTSPLHQHRFSIIQIAIEDITAASVSHK
jgi:hypothetical protein